MCALLSSQILILTNNDHSDVSKNNQEAVIYSCIFGPLMVPVAVIRGYNNIQWGRTIKREGLTFGRPAPTLPW